MDADESRILAGRLIPMPERLRFLDGPEYRLCDRCAVRLKVAAPGDLEKLVSETFRAYWSAVPEVVVETVPDAADISADAYAVDVSAAELVITARGRAGVLNALKTLRQLAEVERGTERVSGYFLVQCEIGDSSALPFRGIHLCVFPETPLWDIEKQLRLAAYHKFNYAVLETWGVFPFDSHPEFCRADRRIDKAELKRLIGLGKELGITPIPQLNLLGHAAASRAVTGKHAVLDFDPALQPLFEPEGWTWCLSNPQTRRILTDLVLELYEFYDRPPFFHIGCDEADNIGTCRDCRRRELKALVRDHIVYFRDLLRERGARVIMWHDMLVEKGDPRWEGYTACGLPQYKLGQLYRELPRDIVIADWQYGYPEGEDGAEPDWPTARFLHGEGFLVLVCPWLNDRGAASLGALAAREGMFGLLATAWHKSHDRGYTAIFGSAADAAWNPAAARRVSIDLRLTVAHHLRQIGWDMKLAEYEQTGFSQYQVDPGHHPHQLS